MQESSSNWIVGLRGGMLPWGALALVLAGTALIDRHWSSELEAERAQTEQNAQQGAAVIADALQATVAERITALEALGAVGVPSVSALDSAVMGRPGLAAVAHVSGAGSVTGGTDAVLGRPGLDPALDTVVSAPLGRARSTSAAASSTVVDLYGAQRIFYFAPGADGAVVVGEFDPRVLLRTAIATLPARSLTGLYGLNGPAGVPITLFPLPVGWGFLGRPVRVADSEWEVRVGYPIPEPQRYGRLRAAAWIAGLVVGLTLAGVLYASRRIVGTQMAEIRRREDVQTQATKAARDAEESAREAAELTAQLEAAHDAAQRLSTSLDPDYVLEFFLGVVGEALDADTASLFTFDEEGELLVGRKRVMLREGSTPEAEGLREEDIREVRVPVAFLPQLAEAASTGEPVIVPDSGAVGHLIGLPGGVETAAAWVTIPLKVGGHMMGVAIWEVFRGPQQFDPKDVAFAQALAAQAAAALRTAELYASLGSVSARATWEANRFGGVLDQMADGVVIADGQGRLERYNAAAERLFGPRPASGMVSEWAAKLELSIDHRPLDPHETPILRALRGETLTRAVFMKEGPGGERHFSASAAPIVPEGGGHAGAAMVVRDVTDEQQYAGMLRHTNQELRKQAALLEEINQQLREATAAKDRFLAVMSHELRTPLNAVIGYADLLDLQIKGPLNPDQNQMVRRVIETARHLLALIDEVLDLAKVGAGQVDLRIEPIPLREVVELAVAQVTPLAHTKGLRVQIAADDAPVVAMADRQRLTQVILNLLSNAVKFTDRGEVTVAGRTNGGEQVELHVMDTGRGIGRDHHERIFEEFYQVEDGLTRSAGGTGLGLAIARRYTRLMGGDLVVESEIGKGSDFVIVLPAYAPAGQPAAARQ